MGRFGKICREVEKEREFTKHCTACKLNYPNSAAERPVCTAALTELELETSDNPGFEQNRSIMDAFFPKCWNIVEDLTWGLGIITAI